MTSTSNSDVMAHAFDLLHPGWSSSFDKAAALRTSWDGYDPMKGRPQHVQLAHHPSLRGGV
jgi:hypothetical protein